MLFILVLDVVKNGAGLVGGCRLDHHFLEATFKGAVFLDVLAIFVKSGCADTLYLATGQCGLQQVGSIHLARCIAGANDGVDLVNEKYDILVL